MNIRALRPQSRPAVDNDGDPPVAPVQIELVRNIPRPIYTIDQLNREQQHLDRVREKLLTR